MNNVNGDSVVTAVGVHAAATGGGHGPRVLQLAVGGPQGTQAALFRRRRRDHAKRVEGVQLIGLKGVSRHERLARWRWQHKLRQATDMVHESRSLYSSSVERRY